jgi:glycosyltransferase involved in cell wall biosynthesis
MKPDVSVIIPVYNPLNLLVSAVEGILAQTAPVSETILLDDGSTEHTRQAP